MAPPSVDRSAGVAARDLEMKSKRSGRLGAARDVVGSGSIVVRSGGRLFDPLGSVP
jgi:hypothetical protein